MKSTCSAGIKEIGDRFYFEIYGEDHKPVLNDLLQNLAVPDTQISSKK
jgi:hypothetical protein